MLVETKAIKDERTRKFVSDVEQEKSLKNNLKLCYHRITNQKMGINDRIGFEYKGKHYVLTRDDE